MYIVSEYYYTYSLVFKYNMYMMSKNRSTEKYFISIDIFTTVVFMIMDETDMYKFLLILFPLIAENFGRKKCKFHINCTFHF